MQKLLNNTYGWLALLVVFIATVYASSFVAYRIDLTAEKRFSLSPSTKRLLDSLQQPVKVQVFLTGSMPADYKKLSIATKDLLDELKQQSHNNIAVVFEKPGEDIKDDTARFYLYDSLSRLGVVFERSEATEQAGEKQTSQWITPSALVSYGDKKPVAIDLRSSRKVYKQYNVINETPAEDIEATRNAAEALLEFKFANAIDKLTRAKVPVVAYMVGNGEPPPSSLTINDLGQSLRNDYKLGVFDLKKAYPDASVIDALLIVKPTEAFTDEDKLKLDQYIMQGGKVVWCIDKLHAELDSLVRAKSDYTAFDRNLNLDDILFKYGVRINSDLLQDLNCSKVPLVMGYNPDKSPRMQRVPFPYFPFLTSTTNNPITKNLDRVLPLFPSSIDTIKAPGIRKTILLASDTSSRTVASPAIVSLNSVKDENDFRAFTKSYVPVAVLLEGKFRSLFANQLTQTVLDSIQKATGNAYAANGIKETKQVVMSDADIVTNSVSQTTGPMPMGVLPFENYQFANREFFLNSIDFLVSNSGIFEARNKDFILRLLDKVKVQEQQAQWQVVNIAGPVFVVVFIGILLAWRRKNKYAS